MAVAIFTVVSLLILVAVLPTLRQIRGMRAALQQSKNSSEPVALRNASIYGTNIPAWLARRR
jgi:hypothetical protein